MAKRSSSPGARGGKDRVEPDDRMGRSAREKDLKWQALDWIRDRIFNGEFPPGSMISALGIAKRLSREKGQKWSRSPVREAMEILANEGLIVWKGISGAEVLTVDKQRLFDSLTIRYAIETQVAQRLGREHDPQAIQELREILAEMTRFRERMGQIGTGATPEWDKARWEWYELDKKFHLRLAELSGMWRAVEFVSNHMDHFLLYATVNPGTSGDVCAEHGEIVDAIEKFNPAKRDHSNRAVREAVKKHMDGMARRWAVSIVPWMKDLE